MFSVINAILVFQYAKQINKSSISLDNVVMKEKVISEDSLAIRFIFNLQITGNEPLNITNISTSYFNYKDNLFVRIYENHSMLNTLYPDAIFNQPASISIINIKELDKTRINEWFDLAIMMRIDYETPSTKEYITYYMKYDDSLEIHHLSRKEYDLMESFLPLEFRISP